MRPTGMHRPRRALLLLAAAAIPACGGNPEKLALRSYEASVEDLMAEDGRVSAKLTDLLKDFQASNGTSSDQANYGKEQALPFYRRFRESAAALHPATDRLGKIHATLREYLGERVAYLESIAAFLSSEESPAMDRLGKAQGVLQVSQKEMLEKVADGPKDREVARAMQAHMMFMQQIFTPFQQGQAKPEEVESILRKEVIPLFERIHDRLRDRIAGEGAEGATARWAKAEFDFFRELAETLPGQAEMQKSALLVQDHWKQSGDLRARFLEDLKAYRESLR